MIHRLKKFHHAFAMFALVAVVVGFSTQDYHSAHAATSIDISGVIFDQDPIEYGCASNGNLTVRVRVNGAGSYSGTCVADTGAYAVTGVSVNPSDVITIFIDDAFFHASYVTKAAASPTNLTLDLYQTYTFISHEDAGPITNANLDQYDSDQNANIDFTVTGNNLAIINSTEFDVVAGKTFTPGGTITSVGTYIGVLSGATLTFDTNGSNIFALYTSAGTVHINGDTSFGVGGLSNSGGTINTTAGTPTTTLSGATGNMNGSMTLYHLAFTTAGSHSISNGGDTVTLLGNMSINTGVFVDQRAHFVIAGNLTLSGTAVLSYSTTPTTTINGSSIDSGSGTATFYNLTKSASGTTTVSGTGQVAIANALTVSAGTLNVTADRFILAGTVNTSGGALSTNGGTVIYAQTAGTTIPTGSSYTNLTLSDGLVGYWKLDETAGSTAADYSGFGHNGTHTGSPTISSDVPTTQFTNDRSLDFNGSSQYVDLGDPSFLDEQFGDKISLSAWVKIGASKSAIILGKSAAAVHGTPFYTYDLFQFNSTLSFRVGTVVANSSGSGTGALITDGSTWQHVAGTYDGTTLRAYINGIEVATASQTGSVPSSNQNLRIGARHTTVMDEFFNGKVDEVRVYRRSLSAQEIRSLASGSHPGGSGGTFTLGGNLDVNGNLTIGSGTLDVDNSQNYSINTTGNFHNFGVLQPRNGTITLDGTATGKTIETGQQRLNNLTIAGSGGGWTLKDRLWVNGTLGISNGTLDVSSANYRVHAGTINQSGGTFTPQSGTVILDAASNQTTTVTSALNNLRIEDPTITNLAGYWKFDEVSGTSAKDSSGNSRTGTLTNAPALTTSLNSTTTFDNAAALDFDGTDDYVTMGDVIDTDDTSDLTISGWFNRDTSNTDDVILAKRNGNSAADTGYIAWIDAATDKLRFEASDGTDEFELASTSTFTATGWNHFTIVWDQDSTSNSEIYISGVDDNATQTGTIGNVNDLSNALALRIGAESDAGAPFDGKIDDVRVHTAVLSTTQITNLSAGRYSDGSAGTATFTLGGSTTVGGTLTIDSGNLATDSNTLAVTNLLTLAPGNGTYTGGTQTQTLSGGLTVSGSAFTGGAGTIDINGTATLSGGTVTTGAGIWTVSGSFTHSGSTFTATAGHTLTMDGTGTLTSNAQTLQNLTLSTAGTVTLANATHTVNGNLVLGGAGTITPGTSTISMTGTGGKTIDGGGKTLANLTIDPSSAGTVTLQNTDLTVSTALSVATGDTLALNSSRTMTMSGNSGTTLTLNGTINGAGRLTYQNSATTFPTSGTIASTVRFDMVNGAMTIPDPTNNYGGSVEVYNGTASSRTATLAAGAQSISGSLLLVADGAGNTVLDATANPTVAISGDLDFTGVGAGSEQITSGTAGWTVAGNIDFTGGTFTASSGNTVTMTGTSVTLVPAGQTFVNLTIDPSSAGTVTMTTSDATVSTLLTVATGDIFSLASGRTATLSGNSGTTMTLNGTISGAGRLTYQNSATTFPTSGTLSSIFRFDTVNGAMTIPQRTFSGQVEVYGASANARTVTLGTAGSQTLTFSDNLYLMAEAASTNHVTLTGATNNPTVNIAGTLDYTGVGAANEILITGTGTWTVTGNIDVTSGTFTATAGNTVIMNGTASSLTGTNTAFRNLTFDPTSTGTITIPSGTASADGTLTVAANDTVSLTTSTLVARGILTLNGTIDGAGTLYLMTSSPIGTSGVISSNVYFDGTSGTPTLTTRAFAGATRTLTIYSDSNAVTIGDAPGTLSVAGSVIINDVANGMDFSAEANDPDVTIGGDLSAENGDARLALGDGTWTIGGNFDATFIPLITANAGTVVMSGASKTMTMLSQTLHNLTITGTITTDTVILDGNLTIQSSAALTAGTLLTVKGSFDNNGTFTHSNGTVALAATSSGKTIECGGSSLYNLTINSASGGWTMQTNDCVIANNFSLTSANNFTLASGRTLTVSGTFTNAVGGSGTTWTGSTVYLTSSGSSSMNTKSAGTDSYGTLRVGSGADIAMWNSDATTVVTDSGGGLLSQDHGTTDGRLQVYGDFNSRTNEYWSAETDFDGTAIGSPRQADVRFADGATITIDAGDTLTILGESPTANRTVITHQGSGSFGLTVNGTINAKYFDADYLNATGLVIGSTATVTDLSYSSFDNSAGGTNAAYLTVNSPTSTVTLTNVVFDAASDGADSAVGANIRATGSGVIWTMASAAGLKRGPTYEVELSGATINWDSPAMTIADGTATDIDLTNQTEELSANWTLSSTNAVDHLMYAIGTTSGGNQVVTFTSVGAALAVTNGSLSLTSGTTYYVTVRAVDAAGETITEATTDGILVDATAPVITDLTIVLGSGTATVTWSTDEAAIGQVQYGTTTAMTSTSAAETTSGTDHSRTITGLSTGTTYYLRVISTDPAGNTGLSSVATIIASATATGGRAAGPTLVRPILEDGTQPAITVVGFAHGSQVVRIFLDGKRITSIRLTGARSTVVHFSRRISLTAVASGRHSITAQTVNPDGVTSRISAAQRFTLARANGKTSVTTNTTTQYRVVAGDSLWKIAQTFLGAGQRYTRIISANVARFPSIGVSPFRILVNWLLQIPAGQ